MGPRSNQSCNEMGLDFGILYLSQLGPDLTKADGTSQVGRRSHVYRCGTSFAVEESWHSMWED